MKPNHVNTPVSIAPGYSEISYEPLGVVCVLAAWNFPVFTLFGPASQVIAAGNCCIMKCSELAPHCSMLLTKLCDKYLDKKFYRCV